MRIGWIASVIHVIHSVIALHETYFNFRLSYMLSVVDIGSNDNTICSPVGLTTGHSREQSKLTARQQTIAELFQTEKNYVGILHTILKVLSVYLLTL